MKQFTLTKSFRFETAHRLVKGYQGKCNHIHGHSWNGEIVVSAGKLNDMDMAVDYKDMGSFCKILENVFDHKLILWEKDILVEVLEDKTNLYLTKGNPTSEHLAEVIFGMAEDFFKQFPHCKVEAVTVKETCTSSCTFTSTPVVRYL